MHQLNHGLSFVLPDGTLDHPKMAVVARTRAVTHLARYPNWDEALHGELVAIAAEASGQLVTYARRIREAYAADAR